MFRRNFLTEIAALSLLGLIKLKKTEAVEYQCISKVVGNLGKALSMLLTNNINLEPTFYGTHQWPNYPIETELTITYEHGSETWRALNVTIQDFAALDIATFFKEYVIIPDAFVPTLQWRQYKFKLSYITLEDTLSETPR